AESVGIDNGALVARAAVARVVAVAANHDNPRRLAAVEPLLALGRISMVAEPAAPDQGGVRTIRTDGGEEAMVAFLPFVSKRAIVRADELMANAGFENAQTYADRMQRVVAALCAGFEPDRVNLVVGHAFVHGGQVGGGERAAHLVDEYALSAVDFPPSATYVALGHLHRPQQMLGATAIHYCGSPLQLDFGEEAQTKQVNVVDAAPGIPAKVRGVPLRSGRPLRTLTGTVNSLRALAEDQTTAAELDGAWLRVRVTEPGRAGLADEVRAALGSSVVDVRVEHRAETRPRRDRDGRAPGELFADYLAEQGVADWALERRFAELHEEAGAAAEDAVLELDLTTVEDGPAVVEHRTGSAEETVA
ncbi:MAG: hypothetical protein AAF547_24535, partial [Actinomycetota bacterium]